MLNEWDHASWERKYTGALTVFNVRGTLQTYLVNKVQPDPIRFNLVDNDGNPSTVTLTKEFFPEYFPIRSRYYAAKKDYVFLERKHSNNNFLIGANTSNFKITPIKGGVPSLHTIDLLSDVSLPLKTCLESGGPLSNRVFLNFMGDIYYRDILVATLDKPKFRISMESPYAFYKQEIQDHFPGFTVK